MIIIIERYLEGYISSFAISIESAVGLTHWWPRTTPVYVQHRSLNAFPFCWTIVQRIKDHTGVKITQQYRWFNFVHMSYTSQLNCVCNCVVLQSMLAYNDVCNGQITKLINYKMQGGHIFSQRIQDCHIFAYWVYYIYISGTEMLYDKRI